MIGILGGTFDPIHNGHLQIATQALARLQLQQVQFMPCALPVHRDQPRATAQQRCDMIESVLAEHPEFILNTLEIERDGPSYTIDSLREIRRRSAATLLLLLGSDAFNGFADWKQPREILELAHLVVCLRPGVSVDPTLFPEYRIESVGQLSRQSTGAILPLEVDAIDCSSSAVRAALQTGAIPRQWLPSGVADYIQTHHLYRSSGD
ncbi:MAG: Nicotinate-nucleotide adenylyltransferase (EC 2.7.7.18) [Olavius algarvensis Gamma 3 endosymbiont]|nr:MAG: Nicotinate-nucleotide adenylyltransferase (EC 2.7.7.18) [Olavius algarvensis Gamma 3 endosymbiont]